MAKTNKTARHDKPPPPETHREPELKVDETGEPIISNEDPDILPSLEEELETTPPYEPPAPAEGP